MVNKVNPGSSEKESKVFCKGLLSMLHAERKPPMVKPATSETQNRGCGRVPSVHAISRAFSSVNRTTRSSMKVSSRAADLPSSSTAQFKRSFNSGLADSTWRATSPAEGFLTHDRMKRTRKTTRESTLMPSTIPNASPSRMGTRESYASRA